MAKIWEAGNRFRIWLDIEILAMEAMAQKGWVPADALARVRKNAKFDIRRIDEIEKRVKHDVIAFLTSVAEHIGEDARLLRGYAVTAFENVALWHERDISHSSAERVIAPDATIVLDFSLARFRELMETLVVYPERMKKNIARTHGLLFSQRVMLALAARGLTREQAYEIVQKSAMEAWRKEKDLAGLLWKDPEVRSRLRREEFRELFDMKNYLRNIDVLFDRVF